VLNIGPSFERQQYPGVEGMMGLQALMCGVEPGNKNPEIRQKIRISTANWKFRDL